MRSCYASQWRLWNNRPDILTRGFFYFASPDTPFYPGFHNFYSRDWTWVRDEPFDYVALGEIKESPRPYEKGILPIGYPPSVSVGDDDCIANGEVFPQVAIPGREIVGGIDTTVWTSIGEPVPTFPVATDLAFWYNPATIPPSAIGLPVPLWNDAGPNTLNLTTTVLARQPTYIATGLNGLPAVHFKSGPGAVTSWLFQPPGDATGAFVFCKSYMLYIVGRLGLPGGRGGPATLPSAIMSIVNFHMRYTFDVNNFTFADVAPFNSAHIWSLRRRVGYLEMARDGLVIGSSVTPNSPQTDKVNGFTLSVDAGLPRSFDYSEILAVNGTFSNAQHLLYLQYLSKKYNIPLLGP